MIEIVIRGVLAWLLLPPLLGIVSTAVLVQYLVGSRDSRAHWAYRGFSRALLAIGGVRTEVRGVDHIVPGQAYILVCNHESNLDPFALLQALPELCIRFVVKRELARIPVFGAALRYTGNVEVDRQRGGGADVRRIEATMAEREAAVSLLFFAEGTRSRDGAFRAFKKGAFATAIRAQLPILPMAVSGTYASLPPARPAPRPGHVAVEIGEPISTAGLQLKDRDQLLDDVRACVAQLRAAGRARLREAGHEPGGVD